MKDAEKIIADFEAWCDGQDESCPVVCLDALSFMKEQRAENKIILENSAGLEKQRDDFAQTIHEQKMEIERMKAEAGKAYVSGQNNMLEAQAEGR